MLSKITIVQTDRTYEVIYNGASYTVVSMENLQEGYLEWDIFDDDGENMEDIDHKLREEIIAFVIHNS